MAVGVASWAGAAVGSTPLWWLVVPVAALVLAVRRPVALLAVVALVGGVMSGMAAAGRRAATVDASLPAGHVDVVGLAATDPRSSARGVSFALRPTAIATPAGWEPWAGPRIRLDAAEAAVAAGEPVRATGTIRPGSKSFGRDVVAGRMAIVTLERLGPAPSPVVRLGNALRARVLGSLDAGSASPPGALLSGFLVGAVDDLPREDFEALRRTGLSHFVAVSGSNVALFLAGWWLVAGPLGWGPRRRAALGLLGVVVFVVVTRWEPSVVRASTMVGLVLTGRLAGVAISPWTALGSAAALALLVSGELALDLGFQLSVAATGGILLGAPLWSQRSPRWVWAAFGATVSAQAAVAPILLARFGTVPLLAPVANLMAAPLVAASTTAGGAGVMLGFDPLISAGMQLAGSVLAIARAGADLPQIGVAGILAMGTALAASSVRRLRPWLALGCVFVVAMLVISPASPPPAPTVSFLDVGQGDATLLRGPDGEVILVDGGPDALRLADLLRSSGVDHIDLLVVSHRHADHAGGLEGITRRLPIGVAWLPDQAGLGTALDIISEELAAAGVDIRRPGPGWSAAVGAFSVEVIGPLRRYASPNDGSLVLRVWAANTTILLPGDIEVIAQRELGSQPADIMKVPHQGSATSDEGWLRTSVPRLAVISVGPNDFGHPSADVIALLEDEGAEVRRTDEEGTITIRLDRFAGG